MLLACCCCSCQRCLLSLCSIQGTSELLAMTTKKANHLKHHQHD